MGSITPTVQINKKEKRKYSEKRCDRCYDKHIKCNRALPSCDQCLLIPKQVCKYEREYIKKSNRPKIYNKSITVINLRNENMLRNRDKSKSETKMIIMKSPFDLNLNYHNNVMLDITSNITRRAALVNLLTILQYPSLFKPTKELHLLTNLSTKLGMLLKIKAPSPKICQQPNNHILEVNDLIHNAIGKFFSHINLHLSLFTRDSFRKSPRSKFLKMTIIAAGLKWIPKGEPLRDSLYSYFEYQIFELLKPSQLKFNLDTLQALLIIFYGLFDVLWVQRRAPILFKMALMISYAIGLPHQTKRSLRLIVERRNAYNALLQVIGFSNLLLIPIRLDPPVRTKMLFYKTKGQCSDIFSQLINYSISIFNPLLNDALLLKIKSSEGYEDGYNVDLSITKFAQKINEVTYNLTQKVLNICSKLPNKMQPKTSLLIFGIKQTKYFLLFFVNTYILYNAFLPASTNPPNVAPPNYHDILRILKLCAKSLEFGMRIELEYTNYTLVSMFNQCFMFMLRYYNPTIHPKEFHNLILACHVYFDSLKDSPFSYIISVNRVLLDELKSYRPNIKVENRNKSI